MKDGEVMMLGKRRKMIAKTRRCPSATYSDSRSVPTSFNGGLLLRAKRGTMSVYSSPSVCCPLPNVKNR